MSTVFSDYLSGTKVCHKILEDEKHLAILEPRPIAEGHVIVFPKAETNDFFALPDLAMHELMSFAKRAAQMIKKTIPCKKIGMMVAGIVVPHVHVHLVPIQYAADLDFSKARDVSDSELRTTAQKILSGI